MKSKIVSRLFKFAAVLVTGLALLSPGLAMAQEIPPEQMELGRKYVKLVGYEGIYQLTLVRQAQDTFKTLAPQNAALEKEIADAIKKVLDGYKGKDADLLDQYARLFATTFTPDELTQLVAFYETPVGQKLAKSGTDINNGMRAILGVYTNNLRTEFFAKVRAELKAGGHDL
ncbi:MAG: DUF2059 domain-containing protein [Devosia sp.]